MFQKFVLFLTLIFTPLLSASAETLHMCNGGVVVHQFLNPSNYLKAKELDSKYLNHQPGFSSVPAQAAFVMSEGPNSTSQRVTILGFTTQTGSPTQLHWNSINLGFVPQKIKLANMKVFGSQMRRMVLIAQKPNGDLSLQLLRATGAAEGSPFVMNQGPYYQPNGLQGDMVTLDAPDAYGTLDVIGRTQYELQGTIGHQVVGVKFCDKPQLFFSLGSMSLRCLDDNGVPGTQLRYLSFGTTNHIVNNFTLANSPYEDKVELFRNSVGRLNFVFVDTFGRLQRVDRTPTTAYSTILRSNGQDLQSFRSVGSSYGGTDSYVLNYVKHDGGYGEIPLAPGSSINQTHMGVNWYSSISGGILQPQLGLRTELGDSDICGTNTLPVTVRSFHTMAQTGNNVVPVPLSGLFVRSPGADRAELITDLLSTLPESEWTYGTIGASTIAQITDTFSITLYTRKSLHPDSGALLMFSLCDTALN